MIFKINKILKKLSRLSLQFLVFRVNELKYNILINLLVN